jgi:hypothetical protein
MLIHNAEVTGSLLVNGIPYNTGSFSGSFLGTISTASYVEYNNVANKPALLSGSAQVAEFGFATTGSNQFNGNQTVTGSLTVTGQVIAQTLNVQQVTSSIIYSSGSNVFGNSLANTQQFTGSVSITGSMNVNGTAQIQNQLRLNSTITNGTHTYTLPSATGTLALVSSLHNPVTLGTANGLSLSTQVLSLGLSSASTNGALSSTDWTAFNNKVSVATLDNYVTLSTAQTINATKTFSISTVSDGILIDNTSGRGIRINNNSTGFGLIINNGTTATAAPITIQKSGNIVLTINDSGNITANSFIGPLTGNATTATTLQTARTISGTSFNGSANITTANWGTARTLTIGSTGKSVNGSANVAWTLAEIGAYAASNPSGYTTYSANQAVDTTSSPTFANIYIADYIYHTGDTNTYTQFHAADQWRVVTGGSERLEVNNTATTGIRIDATSDMRSPIFYDSNNTAFYINPAAQSELKALRLSGGSTTSVFTELYIQRTQSTGGTTIGTGANIELFNVGSNRAWILQSANDSFKFFFFDGSVYQDKFRVLGNGGLANVSGNNVNLSDQRLKKDITPLSSYWGVFKNINIVKFKYKDQTNLKEHIGVIAQELEQIAPEFVSNTEWNTEEGIKTVFTSDLHHATIAVLKEALNRIEQLESKLL